MPRRRTRSGRTTPRDSCGARVPGRSTGCATLAPADLPRPARRTRGAPEAGSCPKRGVRDRTVAAEPTVQRGAKRRCGGGVREILRVERDAGQRGPTLQHPPRPCDGHRPPGTRRRTRAPPHHWRANPPPRGEQPDRAIVLAEAEAVVADGTVAGGTGEPGGRHESDRREAQGRQARPPARDSLPRGGSVQGEELA